MLRFSSFALRTLLMVLALFWAPCGLWAAAEESPSRGLVLRITPEGDSPSADDKMLVSWQLENTSDIPVYICQWPGIAFGGGWENLDGTKRGFGPGYPETRNVERKYFIELKAGEALFGSALVDLFPTPTGEMWLKAEYRSHETGERFGLRAWSGRVYSDSVRVKVTKKTNAGG